MLALNRNNEAREGLAEVIVATRDGDVDVVTGDWVATKPSFSPDCRSLVVVRAHGDYESTGPASTSLSIIDTDGTNPRALTRGPADDDPAWSPDGETIALSRVTGPGPSRQLAIVPAQGGDVRPVTENHESQDLAPAWSQDGHQHDLGHLRQSASLPDLKVTRMAAAT